MPLSSGQVLIGGGIGYRPLAGEMRGLMAYQSHPVGQEIEMRQLLRATHRLFRRRVDVAAARAGADGLTRGLLNGIDLTEQILKFGIRFAEHCPCGRDRRYSRDNWRRNPAR